MAIAGQIERLCEVMESALPKLLDLLIISAYPGAHASTATAPGKTH